MGPFWPLASVFLNLSCTMVCLSKCLTISAEYWRFFVAIIVFGLLFVLYAVNETLSRGGIYASLIASLALSDEVGILTERLLIVFILVTLALSGAIFYASRKRMLLRISELEGELPQRLRDGSVRLLSIDWLRDHNDWRITRHQELPPEAFRTPDEAVKALEEYEVGALSYRWLAKEHPDPEGFHATALRNSFETEAKRFAAKGQKKSPITSLFIDFCALPQRTATVERTDEETATFKFGLKVMSNMYASPRVKVFQHKQLPPALVEAGVTPYDRSGWCTFEQSVASMSASTTKVTQLSYDGRIAAMKAPKLQGAQVEAILLDEERTYFFGRADRPMVADMYRDLYEKMVFFDKVNTPLLVRIAQANRSSTLRKVRALVIALLIALVVVAILAAVRGEELRFVLFPLEVTIGFVGIFVFASALSLLLYPDSGVDELKNWYEERNGSAVLSQTLAFKSSRALSTSAPVAPAAPTRAQTAAAGGMPTAVPVSTQRMQVVVPAGLAPGQPLQVQTPAGPMTVNIPDGVGPGTAFEIIVPATTPATYARS